MPVIEFADTAQIVKQRVWVETNFDSDRDGKLDRVHADIVRPGCRREGGTQGPDHHARLALHRPHQRIPPTGTSSRSSASPGPKRTDVRQARVQENPPLRVGYATQWVPRGFATVAVEQAGTGLSMGCPSSGDTSERTSASFVIDWLNGRAKGYTTVDGNEQVSATSWSSGKVGMYGTSYEGTMPMATATTGVKGLEAIIPISPNTSHYRYYRSYGLVRSPGGYLGEDIDVLYDFIHSGRVRATCDTIWRDGIFKTFQDRESGDFNDVWELRDQTQ